MSVEEMVKSITVSSANDCACAMAEFLAGSRLDLWKNECPRQGWGMEDTHLSAAPAWTTRPSAAEHLTSAYDIALMSRGCCCTIRILRSSPLFGWIRCETARLPG